MKNKYIIIVILTILAVMLLAGIPLLVYYHKFGSSWLSSDLDKWEKFGAFVSGTVGTMLSLFTLVITAGIAIEFNIYQKRQKNIEESNQLQQTTISLFKELRSTEMKTAREQAREVRKNWDDKKNGATFKIRLIKALVMEECDTGEPEITTEHIKGIYDLLAFYKMLSLYQGSKKNIQSLNYFYYAWWRKFLHEVSELYDEKKAENLMADYFVSPSGKAIFERKELKENLGFKKSLNNLDELCGFSDIPATHFMYLKYEDK